MPSPTPPGALAVVRLFAGTSLRRVRRGRLVQVVAAILALPLLAGLVALLAGKGGAPFFEMLLAATLRYLLPSVMALFATASIAEEVQRRTITYLYARPIPRWTLPAGKYVGVVGVNLVLFCGAVALSYALCIGSDFGAGLPRLAAGLGAVVLGVLHFGAVAAAFGAMATSYPFAAMLAYELLVDVGFGFIPGVFKALSAGVHLTVLAGLYKPHTDTFFMPDPRLTPAVSFVVLVGLTLIWLAVALGWAQSHEYRTDR
jgi:ABC-type transport system involved in multi-copper enzyme maturation permease subunit